MDGQTKELIEQMQKGSQAAFDEIYRREAGKLYRLAYLIAGNHSDSEDILQETFVKCYLHCRELKQPEGFEKWLTQILVRTAWRFLKKRGQVISLDEFCEREEGSGYQEKLLEDTVSPGPLEQILSRESESQVYPGSKTAESEGSDGDHSLLLSGIFRWRYCQDDGKSGRNGKIKTVYRKKIIKKATGAYRNCNGIWKEGTAMKGQTEQDWKEALHAQAEQVNLEDERKETLLRDIHFQIRERSHIMKKFTAGRKVIAVAAALPVVLGAGVVMGAGKVTAYLSVTNLEQVDYRTAEDTKAAAEKLGAVPKVVESFADGTSFKTGYFHMVDGVDEAGNKVESYPEITIDYSNDLTMTVSKLKAEMYGDFKTEEYKEIPIHVKSEEFLLLPRDAEPSAEDKKAADEGKLSISYGVEKETRETFHYVTWEDRRTFLYDPHIF